jgi:methyl-accepting chemotaxis protein
MFNRLTVNVILKSIIAVLVGAVVVMLSLGAWQSWGRLQVANRMAAVAESSIHLFTALHNLRLDRSRTARALIAESPATAMEPMLRDARASLVPALKSAHVTLAAVDFPQRDATVTELDKRIKKLAALHEESGKAMLQPKAARRAALIPEFSAELLALIEMLDKLSTRLIHLVKLDDAYVDQLLAIRQFAWAARNAGGDAAVTITNALSGLPLPANVMSKHTEWVARTDAAWEAIEDIAASLKLPPRFTQAMDKAKRTYFAADYTTMRMDALNALTAGKPSSIKPVEFSEKSIPGLATLLGVAEVALEVAKEHAGLQRSAAMRQLSLQLGLLGIAAVLAFGMMLTVVRRVTRPLHAMQSAMNSLANGDLSVDVPFAGRGDEIGTLAKAMEVFKTSMSEATRLRVEQTEAEQRAATERKSEMRRLADEFQAAVGNIVDAVSVASTDLEGAAKTLSSTADSTQQLSNMVAAASTQASANVQTVASAAEEMSSSVDEIAKRVHESSAIATEAVRQAEKTDARITELSNAASRIGDVVKLITAIAEQTNLLALNATIEAARAGDAGRGFAVVAQEVKALAAQTAKATDEIGTQIASMQAATQDSVGAIKEIGGTIGRISEIAGAIAAAVQEQGAATQEISRNVHQAAQGTTQVADNITDVSRGASETGTASAQVLGSAQSLARESGRLKSEVERFLHTVRAA